ncbi:MAG: hypothetical protein EOR68_20300 [Mesorhizobium sp.]|nr:MAG: hypothetical protein EOR68_20300 [Mesorhizobium sp.]TIP47254.1 MAG: hypothetical protein E5X77_15255 [Mesorhizobium sp.]
MTMLGRRVRRASRNGVNTRAAWAWNAWAGIGASSGSRSGSGSRIGLGSGMGGGVGTGVGDGSRLGNGHRFFLPLGALAGSARSRQAGCAARPEMMEAIAAFRRFRQERSAAQAGRTAALADGSHTTAPRDCGR